ncbi:MAG: hypothetical protein K0Q66_200 [Chitinophagaceae bacterium]|jgi:hypothetical protein|nr:hypothetical protein [Chitinophagaceae bacterium]
MARMLMTIMIIFMAVGPLAHGYLAFKLNATQTLVAEEETHDEKPQGKVKGDPKDQYFSCIVFHSHSTSDLLKASHQHYLIFLSKGYAGTPFMPPEMI